LYRLEAVDDLDDVVREKYRTAPEFEKNDVEIGGRTALLVAGSIQTDRAKWAPGLSELTGIGVHVGNETAAALLLIRDASGLNAWALSYGMGFQLIDQRFVDPGFGRRVAVRAADPSAVRSVTRTTLDHLSKTDRSTIPGGEFLASFGAGGLGEIVSRLIAPAEMPSMTGGTKQAVALRAADALSVPLGRTQDSLLKDLDELERILELPIAQEFEDLERILPVKNPDVIESLDAALIEALKDRRTDLLAVSWPHERVDDNGTPSSYRVMGAGRDLSGVYDDVLTLQHLLDLVNASDDVGDALSRIKVQVCRDAEGEEPISTAVPLKKWIGYEHERDGVRHCYSDSIWYRMDVDYAARVQEKVEAIFDRDPGFELPDWDADLDEGAFNEYAAGELGALLLDKDLVKTELHPRGIEMADLLLNGDLPVHVKKAARSTNVSHLVAQALVATEALLHDETAREALREKIERAGADAPDSLRPDKVVVAVASDKGGGLSPENLFTFSKVTIARLDAQLAAAGVRVFLLPISIVPAT